METTPHQHILSHFQEALDQVHSRTLQYGIDVLTNLKAARLALFQQNKSEANKVIANEEPLLDEGKMIELLARRILSQFYPLAGDLRRTLSLSRCSERLQATLRETSTIALSVKVLLAHQDGGDIDLLEPIFDMAERELYDAMDSIKLSNCELASSVRLQDKKLDALHRELLKDVIDRMAKQDRSVSTGLELLFIVRAVERIGDHAKAIAAFSVFAQSAQELRHQGSPKLAEETL